MSNADVPKAKQFFHDTWNRHCTKSLTPQAKHELKFLFRQTLAFAVEKGATWDAAAESYVGPKLAELATNVQKASENPATDVAIERESIAIIRKYQPSSLPLLWCAKYKLPSGSVCTLLPDAERLFFGTFRRHCNNLDPSGEVQLDYIFRRTVKHALCVKGDGWDPAYLEPRVREFAQEVQQNPGRVDHVLLHKLVSDFIRRKQDEVPPPKFFVWCVDYPRNDLEG
jgi:hypothetical protein